MITFEELVRIAFGQPCAAIINRRLAELLPNFLVLHEVHKNLNRSDEI